MGLISKYLLQPFGYKVVKLEPEQEKYESEFMDIYLRCKPYTMTSIERMYALYNSINYVIKNNIEGDFVECGVWRGGSSMLIALTLQKMNANRKIYMYDTFEGMSEPTEMDLSFRGDKADVLLSKTIDNKETSVWCYASLEDVKKNLALTKYAHIEFVQGKVEDTIPVTIPISIALLRLDTDWYESTAHELNYLYPLLTKNGVLIIDDYGHWEGARKAVDEYFVGSNLLLNRIDYTGRLLIKNI